MPTEKLYWLDSFATDFEAAGATVSSFDGRPSLVTDKTLFYPEAGGQLGDTGVLRIGDREVRVLDVQIDDDARIHHITSADAKLADVDLTAPVRGTIDRARRRDHMAQHTAQHMLSRALVDVARAETVSARLGAGTCTLDVSIADVADGDLARAEDLVNAVVRDDVPVRALFPTPDELAQMKLRREPKVTSNIRVIDIEGFDQTPCGGTHCTRSGQIGSVAFSGTDRIKGKLRISFHAGGRAILAARAKDVVLHALAKEFTCGPLDVGLAVNKLRADMKTRLDALSSARGELVELIAERVLSAHPPDASGTTRIVLSRDRDGDVGMLRTLAGRVASRADVVAFAAGPDPDSGDLIVVVQRGASTAFDCGRWLKGAAAKTGGRGGGRPERAEGRLPRGASLTALALEDF